MLLSRTFMKTRMKMPFRARAKARVKALQAVLLTVAVVVAGGSGAAYAAGDLAAIERNLSRATEMLDEGVTPGDGLTILAELILGAEGDLGSTVTGRLSVQVSDLAMATDEASWLLSFVSLAVDDEPIVRHVELEWPTGAGGRGWTFTTELVLAEEFMDGAVVIEDLGSGRWGGSWVEFTNEATRRPPGFVVLTERDRPGATTRQTAGEAAFSETVVADPDEDPAIRLVPPGGRPILGRARFRTVVTTELVDKAVFFLDGQQVGVDERAPFSAVIDLGKEPARHEIRVEAFDSRELLLGTDRLEINVDAQPFRVAIRELAETGEGWWRP